MQYIQFLQNIIQSVEIKIEKVVLITTAFSAPEPKAQVHYCDHTLSVVRPSLTFTFLTSPLKPLNRIQRNLTGSKISMSSTKFVFFVPIG